MADLQDVVKNQALALRYLRTCWRYGYRTIVERACCFNNGHASGTPVDGAEYVRKVLTRLVELKAGMRRAAKARKQMRIAER